MKYVYLALILMAALAICCPQVRAEGMAIHNGSQVAFDYTLTVDGKEIDSSASRGPLQYTQGDGKIISGLARQLEGLQVGAEKTIEVKPEEAYGKADPKAFKDVPMSELPPGKKPEVGMMLRAKDRNGQAYIVHIAQVKKDSVVLDLNHPLAGKTLLFKVKIVSVK